MTLNLLWHPHTHTHTHCFLMICHFLFLLSMIWVLNVNTFQHSLGKSRFCSANSRSYHVRQQLWWLKVVLLIPAIWIKILTPPSFFQCWRKQHSTRSICKYLCFRLSPIIHTHTALFNFCTYPSKPGHMRYITCHVQCVAWLPQARKSCELAGLLWTAWLALLCCQALSQRIVFVLSFISLQRT